MARLIQRCLWAERDHRLSRRQVRKSKCAKGPHRRPSKGNVCVVAKQSLGPSVTEIKLRRKIVAMLVPDSKLVILMRNLT
jgi:hypothetical protein